MSETNCKITSVNFYTVMSKIKEIKMFQFYQKLDKSTKLSIVIDDNFNEKILNNLKKEIHQRIGNIPLIIEVVDEIQRDKITGKIIAIPTLHFNVTNRKFTLKRAEKRVSTLKSLGKGKKTPDNK